MRKGLIIELIGDVVTSGSAATAATPEALPYIPGAMLLGAAAKRAAADGLAMNGPQAFALFHGGGLCFDDGLPADRQGQLALPVPLSLHRRKGSSAELDNKSGDIRDYAHGSTAAGFDQLRGRAYRADGSELVVAKTLSMRTAIDPKTGLADEGRLFGYEALCKGQIFWAGIEGKEELVDRALQLLTGEHDLGRSRAAEFGRVHITPCEPWILQPASSSGAARYVWFLSDFWAADGNGLPTLRPEAVSLGTSGRVDWTRSYLRTRRFAPYNAHWQKRAPERVLITRGSVLTLSGSELKLGLSRFGMGQELGYGLALVTDRPPRESLLSLEQPKANLPQQKTEAGGNASPLIAWLERRSGAAHERDETADQVRRDVILLRQHYRSARNLAGGDVGPGLSQWGRVRDGLARGEKIANLTDTDPWKCRFGVGEKGTFQALLAQMEPSRLALLAKEMRARLGKESWPDDE